MFQRLLHRWFGTRQDTKSPKAQPRLNEEEVLAIARDVASEYPGCESLSMATFEEQSGTLIWSVSSLTIGSSLHVSIDDTTGQVLEIKRLGVRRGYAWQTLYP